MTIRKHTPCNNCGSSDARTIYEDGEYCFSCNKGFPKEGDTPNHYQPPKDTTVKKMYTTWRGVTQKTMEKYGVLTHLDATETPICIKFPYGDSGSKVRRLDEKQFYAEGNIKEALPLFGMDKFPAGSAKAITITEGEMDAMSVYEMMGDYPAVSLKNSSSARSDCEKAYDYINSFSKIYLALDADKVGQEATMKIAGLFDVNKVFIVKLDPTLKDANGYLEKKKRTEFSKTWWAAKKHRPKNIMESFEDIEKTLKSADAKAIGTYPFSDLQSKTYGIRGGEVVLFKAPEKIGKTEVMRAIEYHLLKTTDHGIGIIHLEEPEKRSIQGLLSYEFKEPLHLPTSSVSIEDQMKKYKELVKKEGRLHFYTHFGSDDPDTILDMIRYLVSACGCKFIFLDHITMIVTGHETDDERRKLDYLSTRMAMMAKDLDFALLQVSHVNDNGETRGSRNIAKVANLIVNLSRDKTAVDEVERNTTKVMIEGNRFAAITGPCSSLRFDPETYVLRESTIEDEVDDEVPF